MVRQHSAVIFSIPFTKRLLDLVFLYSLVTFSKFELILSASLAALLASRIRKKADSGVTQDSALLAFVSVLLILLIGMLGDALATRLGRLNLHIVGGGGSQHNLTLGQSWKSGNAMASGAKAKRLTPVGL